jgi:hypothetical protein
VPPITLNFLRWLLRPGCCCRWPMGCCALTARWRHWRRYALLGLLGIGTYNAPVHGAADLHTHQRHAGGIQHAGLDAGVGALCFGAAVTRQQLVGAALSMAGVLLVLSRGEWSQLLSLRLVAGDVFMLLATVSWAFTAGCWYAPANPQACVATGRRFLMAQWSSACSGRAARRSRMGAGPQPHHLGLAAGGCSGLYRHR